MKTYRFINPKWGESRGEEEEKEEEGVTQANFQHLKLFIKQKQLILFLY